MTGSRRGPPANPVADGRYLEPDEFSFFGFGELRPDEIRQIERLFLRSGPRTIAVVENAVLVPGNHRALGARSRLGGVLIGADGSPVAAAELRRKRGKVVAGATAPSHIEPEASFDGDVVFLGHLFNHFGRVLLESLARAWYLDQVPPSVPVVFATANSAQSAFASWTQELLSRFGIPSQRILAIDRPTRLSRVTIPDPLFQQFHAAHIDMPDIYRAVAVRVAGDITPSRQPLYLSRRRLSSRQRAIVGEADLEPVLRDNEFRIAYPETMPIDDQIRLINSHTDIFSSAGSAAHAILFALHAPRLHLFVNRDHIPTNYFLCSALAGTPTTFVNCLTAADTTGVDGLPESDSWVGPVTDDDPVFIDSAPVRQATPQLLDFAVLLRYLDERGLLVNKPPAMDQEAQSRRRDEYREVLVYAGIRRLATKSAGPLPAELEAAAQRLAPASWPVSLVLALHCARVNDIPRLEAMAVQFVRLARAETDADRIARYRVDVLALLARVEALAGSEVLVELSRLVHERFGDNTSGLA